MKQRVSRRVPLSLRLKKHSKVLPNGCCVWTGSLKDNGYGQVLVDGHPAYAHRAAWALANGPVPEGVEVCHTCDNPPCILLAHLFLGTQKDNMEDMAGKNRSAYGEKCATAKLTTRQVVAIKSALSGGKRYGLIAGLSRKYGVQPQAIYAIRDGKTWRRVGVSI